MKTLALIFLLSIFVLRLNSQPAANVGPLRPESQVPNKSGMFRIGIDPLTWRVVGLETEMEGDELDYYNTPDKIEERWKAALVLSNPKEYFRLYPKSEEQLKAEAEAVYALTHPKTIDDLKAAWTPAQIESHRIATTAFLMGISIEPPTGFVPPWSIFPEIDDMNR